MKKKVTRPRKDRAMVGVNCPHCKEVIPVESPVPKLMSVNIIKWKCQKCAAAFTVKIKAKQKLHGGGAEFFILPNMADKAEFTR